MAPEPETAAERLPASPASAILVVDDERQIVDLLTRYLAQHGFRTLGVYAAEDAKRLAASDPSICVVLSDLRMPGQSGVTLAEEMLRGRPESDALEVVLITGAGAGEPALEAFGDRAFHILRKPFRPSEVASVAGRALAAAEARRREARGTIAPPVPEVARGPATMPRPAALPDATAEALRASLLPVLAAAEALARTPRLDRAEARAQAERIRDGALRMLALIDAAGSAPDSASAQTAA